MTARATPLRREAPKKPRRNPRPRIVYRVESLPGKDDAKGEEIARKWLAGCVTR